MIVIADPEHAQADVRRLLKEQPLRDEVRGKLVVGVVDKKPRKKEKNDE